MLNYVKDVYPGGKAIPALCFFHYKALPSLLIHAVSPRLLGALPAIETEQTSLELSYIFNSFPPQSNFVFHHASVDTWYNTATVQHSKAKFGSCVYPLYRFKCVNLTPRVGISFPVGKWRSQGSIKVRVCFRPGYPFAMQMQLWKCTRVNNSQHYKSCVQCHSISVQYLIDGRQRAVFLICLRLCSWLCWTMVLFQPSVGHILLSSLLASLGFSWQMAFVFPT